MNGMRDWRGRAVAAGPRSLSVTSVAGGSGAVEGTVKRPTSARVDLGRVRRDPRSWPDGSGRQRHCEFERRRRSFNNDGD